jgi:pyruvate dehydrogenase E2 component (dihydrolipoamide acetyltransferase)
MAASGRREAPIGESFMNERMYPITMPKWGIEMQEGTVTGWHVAPGQRIEKGQHLLDVETEKIVNSVEAPYSGVLRVIVADAGASARVGALIGVLADATVTEAELGDFVRNFKAADARFEQDEPLPATRSAGEVAALATSEEPSGEVRVSPIARRVAGQLGVDISKVRGTGRDGRISKEDVEAFAAQMSGATTGAADAASAAPATAIHPTRRRMSPLRIAIAKKVLESKQQIPHYRLSIDIDCGGAVVHRQALVGEGRNVSLNDLWVRAAALALMRHPLINSRFVDDEILEGAHADICVAVATEAGLFTPVVRAAESKSAVEIGGEIRALARRAHDGALTHEDTAGGTFTVSNLGMLGVDRFDAIINPPQVAILAIGAAGERAVVRGGALAVATLSSVTLSADHRVVDGAHGAQFLATLKSLMEQPGSL